MLSTDKFITDKNITGGTDIDGLIAGLCRHYQLIAYLLCEWHIHEDAFDVISSWPVPIEPFRGNDKTHVDALIRDCVKHPQAHCHSISHLGIPNIMRRLKHEIQGINRTWFIPIKMDSQHYLFFGFPPPTLTGKSIPDAFVSGLYTLLAAKHGIKNAIESAKRIHTMELYVKEVGHDIASAVQATIAKLRNISDGLIPNEFIGVKAAEAEHEIMAAYRVAEGLGLTMESDYQVKEFHRFNLVDSCQRAIVHHMSEAQERNLTMEFRSADNPIWLMGDKQAFEQLIGHLISNAVKYSYGNTKIEIIVSCDYEYASLQIRNIGIKFPAGADAKKIWDFGFRGTEAIARHVNGSGIGLYTVKKLILAHHGTVTFFHDPASQLTSFTAKVPLASYLKQHHPEFFIDAIATGASKG